MQYPIVYLILKRMRNPLILLIIAWTIAILGLTLIPGVEVDGIKHQMTIFEAFYFVSYMATTIGFGEPEFGLTGIQRLWVSFSLYLTVISWLFAIGNIISLLSDPTLKLAWKRQKFIKQVKRINRKFFIICGYGETGELLLEYLNEKGYQCVVIDNDPKRTSILDLNNIPYIQGDINSEIAVLQMAGLDSHYCYAVFAVTNNEQLNVKIAATTKVLQSSIKVICRATSKEAIANAKSFDTDYVINTNKNYAENIALGFRTPSIQQLTTSLLQRSGKPYRKLISIPKGLWIICGNNAFSNEMVKYLEFEGMDCNIINQSDNQAKNYITGKGTDLLSLKSANIENAVGIVAGTNSDTDNLSIIMTARHIKPNLYFIAKQNIDSNRLVFQNAEIDSIMEPARLLVWQAVPLITKPILLTFLRLARHQDEQWGKNLMATLKSLSETVPSTYLIEINDKKTPAVSQYLESKNILRLQDLYISSNLTDKPIALPLMLIRNGKKELLPKMSTPIKLNDIFLMTSTKRVKEQVLYTVKHEQNFYYVIHGQEKPVSIVMKHIRENIKEYKIRIRKWKKHKQ